LLPDRNNAVTPNRKETPFNDAAIRIHRHDGRARNQ
jgi:hypothetical protein